MVLLLIVRVTISIVPHIHYVTTKKKFNYILVGQVDGIRRFVPEQEAENDNFWESMFAEEGSGMDFYTTIIGLVLTNEFTGRIPELNP